MSPKRQEQSQGQQPRFLIYCQKLALLITQLLLPAISTVWLRAAHFGEQAHPVHVCPSFALALARAFFPTAVSMPPARGREQGAVGPEAGVEEIFFFR